ncbi:MAG: hypothetical protein HY868_01220 [Chloroflexi bacterium]|nr:hypothetical protein [Chloroflexota bacterium]
MNRFRLIGGALIFAAVMLACGQTTPTAPPTSPPTTLSIETSVPTVRPPATSPNETRAPTARPASPPATSPSATRASSTAFAFGVEYILPGLAQTFAQTGARSTRTAAETFGWRELEPNAPRAADQHIYRWDKVDPLIAEYQSAGFDQIQIYTTAWNEWASSKPKNYFPDAQFLDDYEAYMFNLVERYDRDGDRDMPGLRYPILDYVVEREWTEFFPGTTDEYLQLLTIAQRAIKRANPAARVWLVPLMMIDVFDANPNANEIAQRARVNRTFRHPIVETQKLLARPELFDVVEIHALGDYTELDATIAWLRGEMSKHGYVKPVFIGDAMGISQFIWTQNPRGLTTNAMDADYLTFAPIRANDALRVVALLEAMKDANARDHDAAMRWFRAEHAKALVKKFAAARHAGYVGMNVWALADIALLQMPRVTSDWFFMGMIEAQMGPQWKPGAPRPAYHALKQTIDKLSDASSTERVNAGQGVVAYRFIARGKPVIVAWHEPGRIYFPGETAPMTRATIPINATRARVTHTITEIGVSAAQIETMNAVNGVVTLTLDTTPVFIELGN